MQETFCSQYKMTHFLKAPEHCAVKRKHACKVVTLAVRASDLGAWEETPFENSITVESRILELGSKGMNDKKEPRLR